MEQLKALKADSNFSWLPEEAMEILEGCFNLTWETIQSGETRESAGRIGYLLHGTAVGVDTGTLLGIYRGEDGAKRPVSVVLRAITDCTVLWFDFDLVRSVCYRACWFHVRLLREIDRMLGV